MKLSWRCGPESAETRPRFFLKSLRGCTCDTLKVRAGNGARFRSRRPQSADTKKRNLKSREKTAIANFVLKLACIASSACRRRKKQGEFTHQRPPSRFFQYINERKSRLILPTLRWKHRA